MNRLVFHQVTLLWVSRTARGGSARFTCQLGRNVLHAMEWGELSTSVVGADLAGELRCGSAELIPETKELSRHGVVFRACRITGFRLLRRKLNPRNGRGFSHRLRFTVRFIESDGAANCEKYLLALGRLKASMRVLYQREAEQGKLLPGREE